MSVSHVFSQYARQQGIDADEKALAAFESYAAFLVEYNQNVNLTAITDDEGIAVKHFLDSVMPLKMIDLPKGAKIIDVGTGAGFPSVPIKIMRPDIQLTMLDSLNKRVTFLTQLCDKLGLSSAKAVHGRAEEMGQKPEYRQKYDIACARAVAHMRELSEYCLPFVRVGGYFISLKGYDIEQELSEAQNAVTLLGGKIARVEKFTLPDSSRRSLVVIEKISQTPTVYPRPSAKMAKKPL